MKRAILEVWGAHPDYDLATLQRGIDEWLVEGAENGIAAVYHEYGTAPPDPYNHAQGSGPDNDYNTWQRVAERASEYAGEGVYWESINPAVSAWYYA